MGLERVDGGVASAAGEFGIEARQFGPSLHAVLAKKQLLIKGRKSYERDVVKFFQLVFAVLAVGALGAVTVPVGDGGKDATGRGPDVVSFQHA